MNQHVRKWGNSAAVRIPARVLAEAGLKPGDAVEVRGEKGQIVIAPVAKPKKDLAALLEGITPENRHEEVDWGPPVGREVW
jgi:antitoxin MazE